jgi:hypothetical protein
MEFKWTVNKLQVAEDNLVIKVELTITGINGDNSASAAYIRNLNRGNSFISFSQLTEQQVLNWCFEPEVITWKDQDDIEQTTTKYLKDDGEAQVTDQIERQLAKKVVEPILPWTV